MAVKFFGQFLVEQNLVSRESLLQAIDLQEQKNLKFGEMALSLGYVTKEDIERAHNAQMTKDLKLGDLLVEMGIMTQSQMEDVITRQKNSHLYIGEALVQVGALTTEQLQKHLVAFKMDQSKFTSDRIELPAGIPESGLWEMSVDMTYKMITRVLGLPFRPGKGEIVTTVSTSHMLAAMDFSGDVEARYIISVSLSTQKEIAKAILREASVDCEPIDVLEDTVMEFVNVVCGNIAAKASQAGKVLNINPPVTIHPPDGGLPVPADRIGLCFPICIGNNDSMDLVLFLKR
jgi:CheY-specific phosphatase CheX